MIIAVSLTKTQAQTDTIAPATPSNVQVYGYEKNIDIEWYNNSEADIAGYNIYIKNNQNFNLYTKVSREKSYYSININLIGVGFYFKVSSFDSSGNESILSDSVYAITHLMTDEEFLDMVGNGEIQIPELRGNDGNQMKKMSQIQLVAGDLA